MTRRDKTLPLSAPVTALLMLLIPICVQADTIYDIRPLGSSVTINGAIYRTDFTQPLGTGHDQFLGIQGPSNRRNEQTEGYNTDPNSNMEFNTQPGTNTDPLGLSELAWLDGYYGFLLDIDQTGTETFLSMDRLEIYLGNAPDLTDFESGGSTPNAATWGSQATGFGSNSVLIYNMDAAPDGPAAVLLDYDNGPKNGPGGSGIGDMLLLVPSALFDPYESAFPWVYLYSRFGDTVDCGAGDDGTCIQNGGPERWHAVTGNHEQPEQPIPEPGTLMLLFAGIGAGLARHRRRAAR